MTGQPHDGAARPRAGLPEPSRGSLPAAPGDDEGARRGPGYAPPPSPAYVQPGAGVARTRPAVPAGERRDALPPGPPGSRRKGGRLARRALFLLVTGLALVGAAGWVVLTQRSEPPAGGDDVIGDVVAASEGARVRVGDSGVELPLEVGDSIAARSVVEAAGDAEVTIALAGGGVVRLAGGAQVAFPAPASGAGTGEPGGDGGATIQVGGGRVWLNPGDGGAAGSVAVRISGGTVASLGRPVAFDCAPVCAVEAPAGGVTVTTRTGNEVTLDPAERVSITSDHRFDAELTEGPSPWAEDNVAADRRAGISPAETAEPAGVRYSALFSGPYTLAVEVVGAPTGDPVPESLRYMPGTTYALTVAADASGCGPPPCGLPLAGREGGMGNAETRDGVVSIYFSHAIDCYDRTGTNVVAANIGSATLRAELDITDVAYEDGGWKVRSAAGGGSAASALETPCNPTDMPGTSISEVELTATGA